MTSSYTDNKWHDFVHKQDQGSFAINKGNWSKQNVPKSKLLESKYLHRLHLGDIRDQHNNKVINMSLSMKQSIARTETTTHESRKIRNKDKKDRATTEMVLDHRTKTVLYGMLNQKLIHSVHGCISTGKEANVYYAMDESGSEFAIKIYKTSILSFKDRARYVRGEHRFERGYSRNPRKMVQLWADKEFRNLHRLHNAFVPCPRPMYVRQNVLLMSLIGGDGAAAPRLKNYKFDGADRQAIYVCYLQIIKLMRVMFWKCNLIHADLSEYNILMHEEEPYMIDVSQSVEPAHPNAFEFLAKDCRNVNDFFQRQSIATLTDYELFEYVLDERHLASHKHQKQQEKKVDADAWNDVIDLSVLDKIEAVCKQRECVNDEDVDDNGDGGNTEIDDAVQLNSHIVRSLFDVDDAFEIHENKAKFEQIAKFLLRSGSLESATYGTPSDDSDDDEFIRKLKQEEEFDDDDDEDDESEEEEEEEDTTAMYPLAPGDMLYEKQSMKAEDVKEMRKANKKIVKASNREKRKHKMPKHVKKRKIKVARLKAGKTVWKG